MVKHAGWPCGRPATSPAKSKTFVDHKNKTLKIKRNQSLLATALITTVAFIATIARADGPLPSWNDGPAKQSILTFVEKVTKPGSPDFVPVAERIAVFDNDGTLWCEQPVPVQFYYVADRVSGVNFNPHVSTGVAPTAYLDQMNAEPFANFTFSPVGAAVYQLGPFGTAAKQLKQWDLKP